MEGNSSGGVPRIMVFRPTWEEFKDFNQYILYMESCGAHEAGLAKIIPPPEWNPKRDGYDLKEIGKTVIPSPICQVVTGKQGIYQQLNIQKRPMTVKELQEMAESERHKTPKHFDYEDLERKYWKNLTYISPIYGADVSGSLTDPDVKEWNINKLGSILDYVNEDYGISIDGVNTAYLYFGMWKTTFAWHTEDMDLYSINYLHFGAPKSWYCIPPKHGRRLESLANGYFASNYKECPAYLRHKMFMISPFILKKFSIPFNKITQEAGEFMVTFPYGYHAGFNHGFNCAESTNFASVRWVEYGKRATQCLCRPDMVRISMDTFVKRFQPEKYDLWILGKDMGPHPENPTRQSAARQPSRNEILCNKHNESLPPEFEEIERKKPKRHLIHKKSDDIIQDEIKLERLSESEEDFEPEDEEVFEVMKEYWCKAGEMEDDLEAEEEEKKKKKTPRKLKTASSDSKFKRMKSEEEVSKAKRKSLEATTPSPPLLKREKTPTPDPKKVFTHPPKLSVCPKLPSNYFTSSSTFGPTFKIPKKTSATDTPVKTEIVWPDSPEPSQSASRTLLEMAAAAGSHNSRDPRIRIKSEIPHASTVQICHSLPHESLARVKCEPVEPDSSSAAAVKPTERVPVVNKGDLRHLLTRRNSEHELSASQRNPVVWNSQTNPSHYVADEERRRQKFNRSCPAKSRETQLAQMSGAWLEQNNWTLAEEAEYNLFSSQSEPHCSVCSLMATSRPPSSSFVSGDWKRSPTVHSISSRVSISDEFVSRSHPLFKNAAVEPSPYVPEMISSLLRCSSCRVCVHAKCYGVAETPTVLNWTCRRCARNASDAKCCLCLRRGGALKPTADGRWAHLICAICVPEVYFGQLPAREPIHVEGVTRDRISLSCFYCNKEQPNGSNSFYHGVCLQCSIPHCKMVFHVSCGFNFGALFVASAVTNAVDVTCPHHVNKKKEMLQSAIPIGHKVLARHPEGGHCQAEITDIETIVHYWVDFMDGSTSKDTAPEYILNFRCKENGPPPIGAAVHVSWSDGKDYDGIFRGTIIKPLYTLSFGGRTSAKAERCEFYVAGEALPKRVKDELLATDDLRWIQPNGGFTNHT